MQTLVRAVAIALVTSPLVGAAESIAASPRTTVSIQLLNQARVSPQRLDAAERIATEIYASAGVVVIWINEEDRNTALRPPGDARTVELSIMLLRDAPERRLIDEDHLGAGVLGVAHKNGAGRGDIAFILVDRLTSTLEGREYPFPWLLGQVIAHEVGHLLLPVNSHTTKGIMRAGMELGFSARPTFTEAQAALIRLRLATR